MSQYSDKAKDREQHHGKRSSSFHEMLPEIIAGSLIVILVVCYLAIPTFQTGVQNAFHALISNDKRAVQSWMKGFGIAGPLILILAFSIQMFLFVVPNPLLMAVSILSYGPLWGSLISLVGSFCASSMGYFLGQSLSEVTIQKFIGQRRLHSWTDFVNQYGLMVIVITRLSSLSSDSISIIAGILKMNYGKYIMASVGGTVPLVTLMAIFGENEKIDTALIWAGGFTLAGLVVYIIIDKRRRRRKKIPG